MKLALGMLTAFVVIVGFTLLTEFVDMDIPESLKQDPVWIVRTFTDALNRHDVNGALVLFADQAIFVDMVRVSSANRAMLKNWLQSQACENDQLELSDIWVTRKAVTWTARVHRGEQVLRYQYHAEVEEGKINYLMFVGDSRSDSYYETTSQADHASKSLGVYTTNLAHIFDPATQCPKPNPTWHNTLR